MSELEDQGTGVPAPDENSRAGGQQGTSAGATPQVPASRPASELDDVPDPVEAKPIDLSGVVVRRRSWKEPGVTIRYDSYTGHSTALTIAPFAELARTSGAGTPKPDYVDIHDLTDGSGDIALVPGREMGKNTLQVSWSKGGARFYIDFAPYFMVRAFPIPDGTRAHIPAEFTSLKGVGPCMVLHFKDAGFFAIEKGPPRKKKNSGQANQKGPEQNG